MIFEKKGPTLKSVGPFYVWRLTKELPADLLKQIYKVISLEEVPQVAEELLAGKINGRVVVDLRL